MKYHISGVAEVLRHFLFRIYLSVGRGYNFEFFFNKMQLGKLHKSGDNKSWLTYAMVLSIIKIEGL